ncbi:Chitin binding domain [Cinara cedri]|uniref:Chitin binding domain n=1 Tax=Cinara cedri TaxID=506608 RepID=A0A5E4M687_9HEMI|nr:Chitin binding domain [Cinara cedri]
MNLSITLLCTIVIGISHLTNGQFQCPAKNGQYEDSKQCDKFYECKDGVATAKLCPDGLVFDPFNRKVNKCDQPFSVDCGDRTELQNPQPNYLCPRRNGYFAHPEEKICNIFYNCIEGEGTEIVCPNGLHFDEYAGTCAWPETAGRTGCGEPDEMKLKDGFMCPKEKTHNSRGQNVAHPVYAHPDDCQKFYVCLNGITPREQGCSTGEVFNEESQKCDQPENVPGCENWFKDDPQVQQQQQTKNKKQ